MESHVSTYLKVFVALLVFTVLEYLYAKVAQAHFVSLVLGLMALAVTKATLVAMFFMHLKFEGRWVYLLLVPAGLLAAGLVLALYPDMARSESRPTVPDEEIETVQAPFEPGPVRAWGS
jgi:cytochrome c oxidase subunit 4